MKPLRMCMEKDIYVRRKREQKLFPKLREMEMEDFIYKYLEDVVILKKLLE